MTLFCLFCCVTLFPKKRKEWDACDTRPRPTLPLVHPRLGFFFVIKKTLVTLYILCGVIFFLRDGGLPHILCGVICLRDGGVATETLPLMGQMSATLMVQMTAHCYGHPF